MGGAFCAPAAACCGGRVSSDCCGLHNALDTAFLQPRHRSLQRAKFCDMQAVQSTRALHWQGAPVRCSPVGPSTRPRVSWGGATALFWSVRSVAVLASCLLPALKDRPQHLALSKGALCGVQSRLEGSSSRPARLPAPGGPAPLLQARLVPRPAAKHDVDHIQAISVEGKQYIPLSEVGAWLPGAWLALRPSA